MKKRILITVSILMIICSIYAWMIPFAIGTLIGAELQRECDTPMHYTQQNNINNISTIINDVNNLRSTFHNNGNIEYYESEECIGYEEDCFDDINVNKLIKVNNEIAIDGSIGDNEILINNVKYKISNENIVEENNNVSDRDFITHILLIIVIAFLLTSIIYRKL